MATRKSRTLDAKAFQINRGNEEISIFEIFPNLYKLNGVKEIFDLTGREERIGGGETNNVRKQRLTQIRRRQRIN